MLWSIDPYPRDRVAPKWASCRSSPSTQGPPSRENPFFINNATQRKINLYALKCKQFNDIGCLGFVLSQYIYQNVLEIWINFHRIMFRNKIYCKIRTPCEMVGVSWVWKEQMCGRILVLGVRIPQYMTNHWTTECENLVLSYLRRIAQLRIDDVSSNYYFSPRRIKCHFLQKNTVRSAWTQADRLLVYIEEITA